MSGVLLQNAERAQQDADRHRSAAEAAEDVAQSERERAERAAREEGEARAREAEQRKRAEEQRGAAERALYKVGDATAAEALARGHEAEQRRKAEEAQRLADEHKGAAERAGASEALVRMQADEQRKLADRGEQARTSAPEPAVTGTGPAANRTGGAGQLPLAPNLIETVAASTRRLGRGPGDPIPGPWISSLATRHLTAASGTGPAGAQRAHDQGDGQPRAVHIIPGGSQGSETVVLRRTRPETANCMPRCSPNRGWSRSMIHSRPLASRSFWKRTPSSTTSSRR